MDFKKICDELAKEIPNENIKINELMSKHTTFKIGGPADIFVNVETEEQLIYILNYTKKNDVPLTIVGNGSDLLVRDKGIRGIVVKLKLQQMQINEEENDVLITVGAGVLNAKLATLCAQAGYTGFEFAAGIPGSIGGAVRMNAGAYGGEFKNIVVETKCIDYNGNIQILKNEQQDFDYRHSIFFNNKFIILETVLKLERGDKEEIQEKMDGFFKSRKEKQPLEKPSAGSTFKRGNDFITAKLIDDAGLRGFSIGDAQVSEKHAGFIVNNGNAKAKDILELVEYVRKEVYEKFGKTIELEVEVIGEE